MLFESRKKIRRTKLNKLFSQEAKSNYKNEKNLIFHSVYDIIKLRNAKVGNNNGL